jgi:anti-sigma factor RsiW
MSTHATIEELRQLRRGGLPPDRTLALTRHLAACETCMALSAAEIDVDAAAHGLRERIEVRDFEHPDVENELTAYVDGTLEKSESDRIETHLETCPRCSVDAADLRAASQQVRRHGSRGLFWAAAAAALLAALLAIALLLLRRSPQPADPLPSASTHTQSPSAPAPAPRAPRPPPLANREWETLVATALETGRVEMPEELRQVRTSREELRGTTPVPATATFTPAGVIVESDRPAFLWPATPGATYVVKVFDPDYEPVASSGELDRAEWTPLRPLPRDVRLAWEVEVRTGTRRTTIPASPDPAALFRILPDSQRRELELARRNHPDHHLLLGILYARAGLQKEAAQELRRASADQPEARRVREWVEGWE